MPTLFLNDHFVEEEEAMLPLTDRGFLFGDGVFTTLRIEEGKAVWLAEHLEKLNKHAQLLKIVPPKLDIEVVDTLIARNALQEGRLKIIYTGGDGNALTLKPRKGRLIMMAAPLLPTSDTLRVSICTLPSFLGKTLSYVHRLHAKRDDVDDCITLNERGEVLETLFGNLFWVIDDVYYTPDPKQLPIYWGVTIQKALENKKVRYVRTRFESIPKEAFFFRTNAVSGIKPLLFA
ncbi:MAG: aminotransferase class IV [Chlamydiales bacterium]|nr:aminotransferase class IV [Chlamydiales bacterium]